MKGYINIELGGINRGVKFGNRALLDIMAKYQVGTGDGTLTFSFDLVVDLVYFGLVNNCMNAKVNVDFTPDNVNDWVDSMPMAKLLEVFNTFQDSYASDEPAVEKKPEKLNAASKKKTATTRFPPKGNF